MTIKRTLRSRFWLMAAMACCAALLRVLPHPPNFTPVAALALFGGARFDRKVWAFALPLTAMLLSDAALELLFGWGFHGRVAMIVGNGCSSSSSRWESSCETRRVLHRSSTPAATCGKLRT